MAEPYDPVDLRGRIAVAFSIGELRQLAASLGVADSINFDRGVQAAARDLVKAFEHSYGGLGTLVAKLRAERPLVEWPEGGSDEAVAPLAGAPWAPAPPLVDPGSLGGAPIPDPHAMGVAAEPPPPVLPVAAPPPTRAWPGMSPAPAPPAARSNGIDPRIFIAVSALTVLAAIIAFVAGRASNPSSSAAAAAASGAATTHGKRPEGPATHLADAVGRAVGNLARACEVPSGEAADVMRRALEQCGPNRDLRTSHHAMPKVPPRQATDDGDHDHNRGGAEVRPRGGGNGPAAPRGGGCMQSCDVEHRACRGRCGAEPTESGRYADWNQCNGRCLAQTSKCRLSCP